MQTQKNKTDIKGKASREKNRVEGRNHDALAWAPVVLSILITCFWAFWGIIENFHEGWYYQRMLDNITLMFGQYLSPMIIFMVLTLAAIHLPKAGAVLYVGTALFSAWFFRAGNPGTIVVIALPLAVIALLLWKNRMVQKKTASIIAVGLPLLTLAIAGATPAMRVANRIKTIDPSTHEISGNGITLTWAPSGPGWPEVGVNWREAGDICAHLDADGTIIEDSLQNIWRLPTADECVRSMALHGVNSGGTWDAESATATYILKPEKEYPLWDIHSPVIYWWTATEVDQEHAIIIAYDGRTWSRPKTTSQTYLAYRCIKDVEEK